MVWSGGSAAAGGEGQLRVEEVLRQLGRNEFAASCCAAHKHNVQHFCTAPRLPLRPLALPPCNATMPSTSPPLPPTTHPRLIPFLQVIGTISGSGRVVLVDREAKPEDPVPVDLDLEKVLGDMPNKTFRRARLSAHLRANLCGLFA